MRRKALTCNNSAVCVAALGTMLKTYRPTALLRLESEKLPKAVARIRVYTAITLDSRVPPLENDEGLRCSFGNRKGKKRVVQRSTQADLSNCGLASINAETPQRKLQRRRALYYKTPSC
uniref:Uncharacterized protein n=1 Tax=Vespula pensylvanica TaxID=30213 RepID=A0A834PFD1_VESPE|nr:hypothetical protein H0235_001048 [Vespula pensylvanica]